MGCVNAVLGNGAQQSVYRDQHFVLATTWLVWRSPWDPLDQQLNWVQPRSSIESLSWLQDMASWESVTFVTRILHQDHPHRIQKDSKALDFYKTPQMSPSSSYLSLHTLSLFIPSSLLASSLPLLLLYPPTSSPPLKYILFCLPWDICSPFSFLLI